MRVRHGSLLILLSVAIPAWGQLPPVPTGSPTKSKNQQKLVIAERIGDLGVVVEGDKVEVVWVLENQGTADLVIKSAKAECGCTIVKLTEDQKTIRPGESLQFKAEFDSTGRGGDQTKAVAVTTNDPVEPVVKLKFRAEVNRLFDMKPFRNLHLRTVHRGEKLAQTLEITPGKGRKKVTLVDAVMEDFAPIIFEAEVLETSAGTGVKINLVMSEDIPLGRLRTSAMLHLDIDGIERYVKMPISGNVVGALSAQPLIVNAIAHMSPRGHKLAPVTVRSTNRQPFKILEADAGPAIAVSIETGRKKPEGSDYQIGLTIRDDAPPGPLGTTLRILTDSLDQPVLTIPIFLRVAPPVIIDPPLVLLRQDGTLVGTNRRVKLRASPFAQFEVSSVQCDNPGVRVTAEPAAEAKYSHIRHIDLSLTGKLPPGQHEAVITVITNVAGAERLTIPVRIDVPSS